MEFLRRLQAQVAQSWQNMSGTARALLVAALLASLGGVAYLGLRLSQTDYAPLARNLPLEEVGALTTRLKEKSIPFKLDDGGTTVLVPADRLATARVEAAGANLPVGANKGFEVFDESPLGMTPFVQELNYTRALQAELARSIAHLQPIAQARVHVSRPQQTPFIRDQKPATASVVLKLKPGARLDRSTAEAIVALVSRAVEGLSPENVSIVDTLGHLLTDTRSTEDRIPNSQLEFRRQLEGYLASKAEDVLRSHLGANRAVVRVAADVNFQRVKEKSETFSPEGKVATAVREQTTKSTTPTGPRGAVGATANTTRTGAAGAAGIAAQGTSQTENTQTDYAVSKTSRDVDNFLNSVNRLTIAAMIDLSDQEGNKLTLTDAQDLIKQAIGFRDGRDEIKVTDVALARVKELPPQDTGDQVDRVATVLSIVRYGSIMVGLLLLGVLGMLVYRRLRTPPATLPAEAPAAAPEPQRPTLEMDEFRLLAESDPERVAEVFRVMLQS